MSEEYEGYGRTDWRQRGEPSLWASAGAGPERLSDHAAIPFPGHAFRVSGFLPDEPQVRRAAPDGWIRHA